MLGRAGERSAVNHRLTIELRQPGHFVDQARKSGASWTEIGQSMGVSKQAAQKRFVPKATGWLSLLHDTFRANPFSRFTDRAKHVLDGAQQEARKHLHDYVGTEHLLLGVLAEGEGIGAVTLVSLGITTERAEERITAALEQIMAAKRRAD
jgi:hypothetical protein